MTTLLETNLPIPITYKGKVRDTYDMGDALLLIATDRISAFDVVLPCGIPDKGLVLNQISVFWFGKTSHIIPNHLIEPINDRMTFEKILQKPFPDYLIGRSMIVHKAKRIPIEAVVRGYLSGSAWEEYKIKGTVSGSHQPRGLQESQKLPEVLFTPTTKADTGHDLPITKEEMNNLLGKEIAKEIELKSVRIYQYAMEHALKCGIIIADTKFEFGFVHDKLMLIDELLTPDSSRFWDSSKYKIGSSQPSFDKQPVRDWLIQSGWNKEPPAPILPDEIIRQATQRYRTAYERLTGKKLA